MGKKTRRIYYALTFGTALSHSFFFAIYGVFLKRHGMDPMDIAIINLVFIAGGIIFEVPTGIIADRFGRKMSFIASCYAFALSMAVYYFSRSLWWFILAEILGAIGLALSSGAFEAWAVDSVIHHEGVCDSQRLISRAAYAEKIGIIFGAVAGGLIAEIDIALPWLFSLAFMVTTAVIAGSVMREVYPFRQACHQSSWAGMKHIFKDSVRLCLDSRNIFMVSVLGFILGFSCQPVNQYWSIHLDSLGVSLWQLGFLYVGIVLFSAVGVWVFERMHGWSANPSIVRVGITLFSLGALGMALGQSAWLVVAYLFVHEAGRGMLDPFSSAYLNDHIQGNNRATVLSMNSMVRKLGALLGLAVMGFIAKYFSITATWIIAAIVATLAVVIAGRFKK